MKRTVIAVACGTFLLAGCAPIPFLTSDVVDAAPTVHVTRHPRPVNPTFTGPTVTPVPHVTRRARPIHPRCAEQDPESCSTPH